MDCILGDSESPKKVEEKRMATWGTDVPEDLELNEEALASALKKEDERKREEKDERKRKYNVKYTNDVSDQLTNVFKHRIIIKISHYEWLFNQNVLLHRR